MFLVVIVVFAAAVIVDVVLLFHHLAIPATLLIGNDLYGWNDGRLDRQTD